MMAKSTVGLGSLSLVARGSVIGVVGGGPAWCPCECKQRAADIAGRYPLVENSECVCQGGKPEVARLSFVAGDPVVEPGPGESPLKAEKRVAPVHCRKDVPGAPPWLSHPKHLRVKSIGYEAREEAHIRKAVRRPQAEMRTRSQHPAALSQEGVRILD